MSIAGKNLRYLRKQKGLTQEEFANLLNIKRSLIGAYEEERAEPRLEIIEQVAQMFELTLDELLLNDMATTSNSNNYLEQRRKLKMAVSHVAEVRFVPLKAAAGYLTGYADPDFIDELNTFTLPMLAPGNYRAFEIIGDSMLPTPSGSVVVGEKVSGMEDIKNNQAYIVVSKQDGIVYKRVVKNTRTKAKLTLVSDNPLYEPYEISSGDVVEIWKAQWVISKSTPQRSWDNGQLTDVISNLQQQVTNLSKKLN
jgi:transcriptional regulator with XRE-family HTH domain